MLFTAGVNLRPAEGRCGGGVEHLREEDSRRSNRLVDNKVCAIDDTWSGLRLVIRLRDRP
jgi:hypothetical protein